MTAMTDSSDKALTLDAQAHNLPVLLGDFYVGRYASIAPAPIKDLKTDVLDLLDGGPWGVNAEQEEEAQAILNAWDAGEEHDPLKVCLANIKVCAAFATRSAWLADSELFEYAAEHLARGNYLLGLLKGSSWEESVQAAKLPRKAAEILSKLEETYDEWGAQEGLPPGRFSDEILAPLLGEDWGINYKVLDEIEDALADWDDSYDDNHMCMLAMQNAAARAKMTMSLIEAQAPLDGYAQYAIARYWMGMLEGRDWGIDALAKDERVRRSERLLEAKRRSPTSISRENRRQQTVTWYDEHRHEYSSDDAIAADIAETAVIGILVPEKFRTVRTWILEHNRRQRERNGSAQ